MKVGHLMFITQRYTSIFKKIYFIGHIFEKSWEIRVRGFAKEKG